MPELRSDNPSFVLHAIDQVKIEDVSNPGNSVPLHFSVSAPFHPSSLSTLSA
jgi:hypothetical protein